MAECVAGSVLLQREGYGGDTPADSALEEDGDEAAAKVELFLQRAQQALQEHRCRLAQVCAPWRWPHICRRSQEHLRDT